MVFWNNGYEFGVALVERKELIRKSKINLENEWYIN